MYTTTHARAFAQNGSSVWVSESTLALSRPGRAAHCSRVCMPIPLVYAFRRSRPLASRLYQRTQSYHRQALPRSQYFATCDRFSFYDEARSCYANAQTLDLILNYLTRYTWPRMLRKKIGIPSIVPGLVSEGSGQPKTRSESRVRVSLVARRRSAARQIAS